MSNNHMNRATFEQLREFIYERSGIYFEDSKEYLLANRLKKRMDNLSIITYEEYLNYLKSHKMHDELPKLFDAITINETYFFRHVHQMEAFSNIIIPEILKHKKFVNIWSAACSSGEEPYTLATSLMEKFPYGLLAKILASDISQEALDKAKRGVYGQYALKELNYEMKNKYFQNLGDGKYKIKNRVKQYCIFKNINLMDDYQINQVRKMDVVFCRNVLIYFDKTSRKRVIDRIYNDILEDGGYLILGATESISSLNTRFKLCHFNMALAYQKA